MPLEGRNFAGSSDGDRPEHDFYPTPAWATKALVDKENIRRKRIWESACGDGAMSSILCNYGENSVYCSDIDPRGTGTKLDFLKPYNSPQVAPFDWIITNPPFKFCRQFVEQAKAYHPGNIALFLKIQFLETDGRIQLINDTKYPLARIWVFSHRVSLYRNGIKMKNGGTMCFAWFVWDSLHQGPPTVGLITDEDPEIEARKKARKKKA